MITGECTHDAIAALEKLGKDVKHLAEDQEKALQDQEKSWADFDSRCEKHFKEAAKEQAEAAKQTAGKDIKCAGEKTVPIHEPLDFDSPDLGHDIEFARSKKSEERAQKTRAPRRSGYSSARAQHYDYSRPSTR